MIYIVNDDHQGAVMIGDRSYCSSQIIRDDGTSPKLTKSIEKLLKLEDCPISLVEEKKEEGNASEETAPHPQAPVTTVLKDTPSDKTPRTARAAEGTSADVSSPANPSRQKEKDK